MKFLVGMRFLWLGCAPAGRQRPTESRGALQLSGHLTIPGKAHREGNEVEVEEDIFLTRHIITGQRLMAIRKNCSYNT